MLIKQKSPWQPRAFLFFNSTNDWAVFGKLVLNAAFAMDVAMI